MLSVTDLLTIKTKPAVKDVSLKTIQSFYAEHLCNRLFVYETDHKEKPVIKIRFLERHLCHLLGIQYIIKRRAGVSYIGQSGYELIKNGNVTFDFLKQTNKVWFKSKKNRMLYFPFVHQVLLNPVAIDFNGENVDTDIDVDIIFYNQVDNTYLHLGLDKDTDSHFYYPKSFYDRKKRDHIDGQNPIKIINKQIIKDS